MCVCMRVCTSECIAMYFHSCILSFLLVLWISLINCTVQVMRKPSIYLVAVWVCMWVAWVGW